MYRRFSFFFFHQAINQFSLSNTSNIFFAFLPNSKYDISRLVLPISAYPNLRRYIAFERCQVSPKFFVRIDVRLSNLTTDFSQILTYTYIYINKYLYTRVSSVLPASIEAAPIFRSQLHLVHFRYYKGVCLRGVECHRFFYPLIRAFVVSNIVDISKRGWSWRIVHGVVSHYFSRHWRISCNNRIFVDYFTFFRLVNPHTRSIVFNYRFAKEKRVSKQPISIFFADNVALNDNLFGYKLRTRYNILQSKRTAKR